MRLKKEIANKVLDHWGLQGHVQTLGSGLINDTFLIDYKYVLQRINSTVFKNPQALMRNLDKVHHWVSDLVPEFLAGTDSSRFFTDGDETWRLSTYYESRTFDELPTDLIEPAGRAFGSFLHRLRGVRVELEPAIDNFHDLSTYLQTLDHVRRAGIADEELGFVDARASGSDVFSDGRQIIHGDCKVNNLLFHPTQARVIRIVDLDTLMWGHPAWDFGDLIRSLFTRATSDKSSESDLVARLAQLCRGFFRSYASDSGSAIDVSAFASAPSHMSFMLGVRFLADHLVGDRYFKVERRGDNLERARGQFTLVQRFDTLEPMLDDLIQDSISNVSGEHSSRLTQ